MVSSTRRRMKWHERPSGVVLVVMLVLSGGAFNPPPLIVAAATWLLVASYLVLLLVVLTKIVGTTAPGLTVDFLRRALAGTVFALGAPWVAAYLILLPGLLYHRAHPEAPWDDIGNTYAFFVVPILLYVPTFFIALALSWEVANPPYRREPSLGAKKEVSTVLDAPENQD